MKYTITGGAGHISRPLAEKLLNAEHQVTVIGRSAEKLKGLTDQEQRLLLDLSRILSSCKKLLPAPMRFIPCRRQPLIQMTGKHILNR